MAVVKGSKQFDMVVVPYRPWQRAALVCLCLVTLGAFSWLAYNLGVNHGMETGARAANERDQAKQQLQQSQALIEAQRQQIADLKVGNQVDTKANEDVRQTIAGLQSKIADLNEQISFYKAVMLPNAGEKGLHIQRLDLKSTGQPGQYHYDLLLTQIVDRHHYIEGSVHMSVLGTQGTEQASIPMGKLSTDAPDNYKFRFRYFQTIDGDLTIPNGFKPAQFVVVANSTGRGAEKLEKKFQWHVAEG